MKRSPTRLFDLLYKGPTPASQVVAALAVSRPTLSRLVHDTPRVVRLGRARSTRYALRREVRTLGNRWPLYRISADGRPSAVANLHALEPRAWWFEHLGTRPDWVTGEFGEGLFPDFPWFLDDLRPQGFVGRAFARKHAGVLGLPNDPRLWDANGVLVALLSFGDDLPGDFVIGDAALARVQRASLEGPSAIPHAARATRYVELSTAALQGELPGSPAAGEQPKFTACVEHAGTVRHVLVKFSPLRDTPSGQRWADLLVCEHLAAELLREHSLASCHTEVLDGGGRCFLEVTRCDRVGADGRRGVVSLFPLDAAYYGKLDTWAAAADRLERDGWLSRDDAARLRLLWWFGGLIGNTDMHFGNVSLSLDALPARLAPAYDMLPMHYRPEPSGEVVTRPFFPPLPAPAEVPVFREAAQLALRFWHRASEDGRMSPAMRAEAARNADLVQRASERFR